jgi:hypothetical protein
MPSRDGTPPAKPVGSPRGNLPREATCHGGGSKNADDLVVDAIEFAWHSLCRQWFQRAIQ